MPIHGLILVIVISILVACMPPSASSGSAKETPPKSSEKPMVIVPIPGFELIDDQLRQYLARCDDGRPICETGMPCYGWSQIALTIDSDGRPRDFHVASSCPAPALPPGTWERLSAWRFNPRVVGGRPVPFESWVILGYFLGVSS